MKKLLLLVTLFIGLSVYSQSRTNSVKELTIGEFNSWVSGDDVSGWDFDKGEEWKERKGYLRVGSRQTIIDIYEKNDGIKIYKDEIKSRTPQNFNEIGIIQITFKGEKYIGFGIEKVDGRYKYPSISEDWYTENDYHIYVFENDELSKLEDGFAGVSDLKVFKGTDGDALNRDKKYQSCYDNLKYLFENNDSDNEIFKFKITESDGLKVVRFLVPQKISKYGAKPIDFENHYFEIPMEKFNELLSLIKT